MKNCALTLLLLFLIPSIVDAKPYPGLKCPTDAKGGKRASVQSTHIRKRLIKAKHDAVKPAKVKTTRVHQKVSVHLPKIKLPAIHLPAIHLKLPHIHIGGSKKQNLSYHSTSKFKSKSTSRAKSIF